MDGITQELVQWLVNQGAAVAIAAVLLVKVVWTLEDVHATLDKLVVILEAGVRKMPTNGDNTH